MRLEDIKRYSNILWTLYEEHVFLTRFVLSTFSYSFTSFLRVVASHFRLLLMCLALFSEYGETCRLSELIKAELCVNICWLHMKVSVFCWLDSDRRASGSEFNHLDSVAVAWWLLPDCLMWLGLLLPPSVRVLARICMCQLCCPSHGLKDSQPGARLYCIKMTCCAAVCAQSVWCQSLVTKSRWSSVAWFSGLTAAQLNVVSCHSRR